MRRPAALIPLVTAGCAAQAREPAPDRVSAPYAATGLVAMKDGAPDFAGARPSIQGLWRRHGADDPSQKEGPA